MKSTFQALRHYYTEENGKLRYTKDTPKHINFPSFKRTAQIFFFNAFFFFFFPVNCSKEISK